ncbi:MAG: hypothetical protein R3E21_06950 [Caenibius sp.]
MAAGIAAGVSYFARSNTQSLNNFGSSLASNTAGAIANAATRSAINGQSFGDNLMRAMPDVIANTIGNLVAEGVAGNGDAKALRQERLAANVEGIRQLVPSADTSGMEAAAQALAASPNSRDAKAALEYETRKLLIANRGNAAVEDLIGAIGGSLPKDYLASADNIIVEAHRDYLVGALIDRSGIWLGEKQQQVGAAVGQFMEEHPGAALAARLFDTGVAAVAPVKYLAGMALDYGKDSISPYTRYSGPAIQMDKSDHILTSSHGSQGLEGALYRSEIKQLIDDGNMRGAMAREIWDVRRSAVQGGGSVSKYNDAIRGMLDYSYGKGFIEK